MTMDEDLNHELSGGMFNVRRRRLQHYTLELNPRSGRYMVKDDRNGETVGAGFATADDAVRAFKGLDYNRTWGYRSEPTAVGDQLLVPGCELRRDKKGCAPKQPSLWDAP